MAPARSVLVTDTTAQTVANCFAITCVTATVFSVLTGLTGASPAGVTFPAGFTLYGNFTATTLTSGSVVLYYTT